MSDNPLMGFIIAFVTQTLSDLTVYRKLYDPPNHELWARGKAYQARLVEALRAGDSAQARDVMSLHMATAQSLMQAQEAEVIRRFMT
jgi:DNA-binding FadR family transcriptional regulator